MTKTLLAAIFCGSVAALSLPTLAMEHDQTAPASQPATQPTTQPGATTQSAMPMNKLCAVEQQNPIDPSLTIEYKGKIIGFCCEMCIPTFKADPEKYMGTLK